VTIARTKDALLYCIMYSRCHYIQDMNHAAVCTIPNVFLWCFSTVIQPEQHAAHGQHAVSRGSCTPIYVALCLLQLTNKNPSLSLFLSSLVCVHLGYFRTDISGIDQASSFHLTHISLSFTVISFTPIFMLFDLEVSMNKWSFICSNFLGTIKLLQFTPLFVFTSSRYHIIF